MERKWLWGLIIGILWAAALTYYLLFLFLDAANLIKVENNYAHLPWGFIFFVCSLALIVWIVFMCRLKNEESTSESSQGSERRPAAGDVELDHVTPGEPNPSNQNLRRQGDRNQVGYAAIADEPHQPNFAAQRPRPPNQGEGNNTVIEGQLAPGPAPEPQRVLAGAAPPDLQIGGGLLNEPGVNGGVPGGWRGFRGEGNLL